MPLPPSGRAQFIRLVTVGYGVFAGLWIFLSDALLAEVAEPHLAHWMSLAKGLTFVAVTTVLLYMALSRVPDRRRQLQTAGTSASRSLSSMDASPWLAYAMAVVASVGMLELSAAVGATLGERPMLILFTLPVILSAMIGGVGPGLLATAIVALGTNWYVIEPLHSLRIAEPIDLFLWCFLIVNGALVSLVSEWLHRARRQAEAGRLAQAQRMQTLGLLREIANRTTEAIFAKDLQGRYVLVNQVAARLIGSPAEEVLGKDDSHLFVPEQVRLIAEADRDVMQRGTVKTDEETLLMRAGPVTLVTTRAPLRDENGTIIGMFGISHDVTAARQAEMRLRESEAQLRSMLGALSEGVILFDGEGRVLSCNPAAERIIGMPEAAMVHRFDALAAWNVIREDGSVCPADRLPVARTLSSGQPCHDEVLGLVAEDGRVAWLLVNTEPMANAAAGNAAAIASFTDITARVLSEQRLRQLSLAVQQSPNSIVISDVEARIEFVNEMALRNSGYSAAELLGQNPRILQSGNTPRETYAQMWGTLVGGHTWEGELHNKRKDGSEYVEHASISPVRQPDGRVTHYVAIKSDVTEEKRRAEELEQYRHHLEELVEARTRELSLAKRQADAANAAKSAFLATMSHEIRTPMNGIVGMIEVLAQGPISNHQAELIGTVRQSALTLLRIIDDILDFSKIEAGQLTLEQAPICIPDVVEGLCTSMSSAAIGKGVELSVFVDPAVPESVLGDELRVRQVLYNLIGNAVKFSAGRPGITGQAAVRVEVANRTPLRVVFRVSDNGIGMSAETVAHLFTAFSQAEASTTRRFGGTGLGLAICKRLVDAMHGDIAVTSAPGRGATFSVTVPFEAAPVQPARALPDVVGLECLILPGTHFDANDLRTYLEYAGARVQLVADADQVVQLAGELQQPVVIRSAEAKDPTGDALYRALSERAPAARHLLITPGRRRSIRTPAPNAVTLDVGRLRRHSILLAVAAAAGRVALEDAHQDAPAAESDRVASAPSVGHARAEAQLILVAEDDDINQKVILEQLRVLGYAAEVANNGAEALHLWRQNEYALLLTDLHMPSMDGYALAQAIRREEGGHRRMPIIALTANALRGESNRAFDIGMDEYLVKPVQLHLLKAALHKWMPAARSESSPALPAGGESDGGGAGELDLSVLKSLVGDDPQVLRDLLGDYRASLRRHAAEMRSALAAAELGKVSALAHRLKSSSRSVGALRLGDLCATVENVCKVGDKEALAGLMPGFWQAVSNVDEAVARQAPGPESERR
jgi:PAS domain S-box-containing protein